ncbi:MAG: hypothetical protein RLZZ366_148 [Pseudomonadota bacterium]
MATLILSTIGRALGGPIGSAIGAVIGQQVDQRLFAPKGGEGPRLGDLAVQSSSYGSPIPKLFGKMRVAGTVIWATDLKESSHRQSNGKGKPKTTVYSYSASFAVLLSARQISRVGRIWADGNLLRGAGGDFKSETGFRLYTGSEGQALDPLIASAEGVGATPAYRGHAYAVFENCQLADFGNRIPSLSFEVFADETAQTVGAMIADLADGNVTADAPTLIEGFAATGDTVRGVAEVLAATVPLSLVDDGTVLTVREGGPAAVSVGVNDLGASINARNAVRLPFERRAANQAPETLTVAYYDSSRDFQAGLQSARRDGGARRGRRIDLPATLSAVTAKALAERKLTSLWAERLSAKVHVPWRYLSLRPGERITLPAVDGVWRISGVALDHMVVELDLVPIPGLSATTTADAGRNLAQTDQPHGPTTLVLVDLPPLTDAAPTENQLAVFAAGISPGWRRAALLTSNDGGVSWIDAGQTAAPAIIGRSVAALGPGSSQLVDRINTVDVDLLNSVMTLTDANDAQLLAGANLAKIGGELIQFASAVPISPGRWRLSGLLRGRRGTEAAITGHGASETFVLIESASVTLIDADRALPGVQVMATGIGDAISPPVATAAAVGAATRPLSPVQTRLVLLPSGDGLLSWIRRSRGGWRWNDGVDAPISEEREAYRVNLVPNVGASRIVETSLPTFTYAAVDRSADILAGATQITFLISQIGTRGLSLPATLTISLP